jgi:PAS domain S-box-containing protein
MSEFDPQAGQVPAPLAQTTAEWLEAALLRITRIAAAARGTRSLEMFATELAQSLGLSTVLITEFIPQSPELRLLANHPAITINPTARWLLPGTDSNVWQTTDWSGELILRWSSLLNVSPDFVRLKSLWSIVLRNAPDQPVGLLLVGLNESRAAKEHEQTLLRVAASIIAVELERIQAEQQEQAVRQHLQILFEESSDLIVVLELSHDGSWNCTRCNKVAAQEWALATTNSLGQRSQPMLPTELASQLNQELAQLQWNQPGINSERRWQQVVHDRAWDVRLIDLGQSPQTGQRHMALLSEPSRALRSGHANSADQRWKLHLQQSPLAVIEWDTQFNITDWNASAERIFGWTRAEAIGQNAQMIVPADVLPDINSNIMQALLQQTGGYESTNLNLTRSGNIIVCEWYNLPLVNNEGVTIGVASLVHDITAKVVAERELATREKHLQLLLDTLPIGIVEWLLPRELVSINTRAKQIFGEQLNHAALQELWGSFAWQQALDLQQHFAQSTPVQETHAYQLQTGQRVTIHWSHVPIKDAQGQITGILSMAEDVTSQVLTEEQLRLLEQHRRLFVEQTPLAVIDWDLEWRVLSWNPGAEKIFGWKASEVLGKHGSFQVHPDDLPQVTTEIWSQLINQRGGLSNTNRNLTKAGGVIYCRWYNTAICNEQGQVVGATSLIEDYTEQHLAEQELKASEERFSQAFDISPIPLSITRLRDQVLLAANQSWYQTYGFTPIEVIGRSMRELNNWGDLEERKRFLAQLIAEQRIQDYEAVMLTKSGTPVEILGSAQLIQLAGEECVLWVALDITARKQAERALRASREQLQDLIQSAQDAIISIDQNEHICLFNPAAEAMFQVAAQDVLGTSVTRFWPSHLAPLNQLSATNNSNTEPLVWQVMRASGELFFAEVSLAKSTLKHSSRQIIILRDITERRKAEQQIRQLNQELEQRVVQRTSELAVANQELEAFCYSVSHDLRAPLRSLNGFSLALLEDYAAILDDTGQDYLRRIRSNCERMGELIDDLLKLSRISRVELQLREVNLSQLAEKIVQNLRLSAPERQVEVVIAPQVIVQGDPNLLQIALENLLGNAWKYTSKHDTARIEFGVHELDGKRTFFVQDDGAGFDPLYVNKMFQPFQRLHSPKEFEGTGIGLATVARIIKRHGGSIGARGAIEQGATIWFTLPN